MSAASALEQLVSLAEPEVALGLGLGVGKVGFVELERIALAEVG